MLDSLSIKRKLKDGFVSLPVPLENLPGYGRKPNLCRIGLGKPVVTGFTLIEVLITVAIIVTLTGVVIFMLNPGKQLAQGRNSQRIGHLNVILNAVSQRIVDQKGVFETGCASGVIPTSSKKMAVGGGDYDIVPCLIPIYLSTMPFDPTASGAHYATTTDYDTGYNILKNDSTGRITISAPSAELGETISVTR